MRLWHPDQLVHGLEGPHGDGQLDGGNFNFQFNMNIFFHFNLRPPTTSWRQTTWRRLRRCTPPTCSSWTRCRQRGTFWKDGKVLKSARKVLAPPYPDYYKIQQQIWKCIWMRHGNRIVTGHARYHIHCIVHLLTVHHVFNQELRYVNQPCNVTWTIEIGCMVHCDMTMILLLNVIWAKKIMLHFDWKVGGFERVWCFCVFKGDSFIIMTHLDETQH